MNVVAILRTAGFALCVLASSIYANPARAQEPTPGGMTLARELILLKGGNVMLDPIVPGVIESAKNMLMQTSPMLAKDLNEVAANLRKELNPKREELVDLMARAYALRFSEAELKDLLIFYKSPLGKKMITDEPQIIDQGMSRTQAWANTFSEQMIARFRVEMKKKGHDL